jgi:hypothetical protein
MKAQFVRKGRIWVGSAVVLVGLFYSVLALTITVKPAYASTCDCAEEKIDAGIWCLENYNTNATGYYCPAGADYLVQCEGSTLWHYVPCD